MKINKNYISMLITIFLLSTNWGAWAMLGTFNLNIPLPANSTLNPTITISYTSTDMTINNIDGSGNYNATIAFANISLSTPSAGNNIATTIGTSLTTAITQSFPTLKNRIFASTTPATLPAPATPPAPPVAAKPALNKATAEQIATAIGQAITTAINNQESTNLLTKIIQSIPSTTVAALSFSDYLSILNYLSPNQNSAWLAKNPTASIAAPDTPPTTLQSTTIQVETQTFTIIFNNQLMAIKNIDGNGTYTVIPLSSIANSLNSQLSLGIPLPTAISIAFFTSIFYGSGITNGEQLLKDNNNDLTAALEAFRTADYTTAITNYTKLGQGDFGINSKTGTQIIGYSLDKAPIIKIQSGYDNIAKRDQNDATNLMASLQRFSSILTNNQVTSIDSNQPASPSLIFTSQPSTSNTSSTGKTPFELVVSTASTGTSSPIAAGTNLLIGVLFPDSKAGSQVAASISTAVAIGGTIDAINTAIGASAAAIAATTGGATASAAASAAVAASSAAASAAATTSALGAAVGAASAIASAAGPLVAVVGLGFAVYELAKAFGAFDNNADLVSNHYSYSYISSVQHGFSYLIPSKAIGLVATKDISRTAALISAAISFSSKTSNLSPLFNNIYYNMPQETINNLSIATFNQISQSLTSAQKSSYLQANPNLNVSGQNTYKTTDFTINYDLNSMTILNYDGLNNNVTLSFSAIGNVINNLITLASNNPNILLQSGANNIIAAGIIVAIANNIGTNSPNNKLVGIANTIADFQNTTPGGLLSLICSSLSSKTIEAMNISDYRNVLSTLTKTQQDAINTLKIPTLTLSDIQNLDITKLTLAQTALLTPMQISYFSLFQFLNLTNDQKEILSPTQLAGLTTQRLNALISSKFNFWTPSLTQKLSITQINSLTKDQIRIISNGSAFTTAQTTAMTIDQFLATEYPLTKKLTIAQIEGLTTEQKQSLTIRQLLSLTSSPSTYFLISTLNPNQNSYILSILFSNGTSAETLLKMGFTKTQIETAQIQALTTAQIQALTTAQIQALTTAQLQGLTTEQLQALTRTQIPNLLTTQIQALTINQIPNLLTTQIQALTNAQIAALTTAQITALTPAQITALTQPQIQVLTGFLSQNQIQAFTQPQISQLTSTQTAIFSYALTPTQISWLTTTQIQGLTPAQIQALTQTQIQALKPDQNKVLWTSQIQAFTQKQIPYLTPAQITEFSYALRTDQISWLTTTQLNGLSANQTALINPELIKTLTVEQIQALTQTQIQALTQTQIQALQQNQIMALTQQQIAALTTAPINQIAGLSGTQIGWLTTIQIPGLTTIQIPFLGNKITNLQDLQLKGLSSIQAGALTQDQLSALSPNQFKLITISGFSTTMIKNLTIQQIQNFTSTQLQSMTQEQIAALTTTPTNQFAALYPNFNNNPQINWLTTNQVKALTSQQLNTFDKPLIQSFTVPDQIQALTPSQIGSLTPEKLSYMTYSQLSSLTAPQAQAITTNQINFLKSTNNFPLSLQNLLTPLTKSEIQNLLNTQLNGILSNLSLVQITYISSTQLSNISTPLNFSLCSTDQIKALRETLTTPQLTALWPTLSATQLLSLNLISQMNPTQIQSLTPAQIATNLPYLSDKIQIFTATQIINTLPLLSNQNQKNLIQALSIDQIKIIKSSLTATQNSFLSQTQLAGLNIQPLVQTSQNSSGQAIRKLQNFLKRIDLPVINHDKKGTYGNHTKNAVRQFQRENNLPVDGIFAGTTAKKANKILAATTKNNESSHQFPTTMRLSNGKKGSDVDRLHKFLIEQNYFDTPGTFGPATHAAIQLFQRHNNLSATGIFDEKTAAVANEIMIKLE